MKYEIFSRARKALIISLVMWLFNRYRMAIERPVIPQLCVIVRDSLRNDEQIICQRLAKGKRDEERERERGRQGGRKVNSYLEEESRATTLPTTVFTSLSRGNPCH